MHTFICMCVMQVISICIHIDTLAWIYKLSSWLVPVSTCMYLGTNRQKKFSKISDTDRAIEISSDYNIIGTSMSAYHHQNL
jgi:hypothetical protein